MTPTDDKVLQVAARRVPVPPYLSAAAQATLAMGVTPGTALPAVDDLDGWREYVATVDRQIVPMLQAMPQPAGLDETELDVDGVRVYEATPLELPGSDARVYVNLHGGGLTTGGGECCRLLGRQAVSLSGVRTWSVDYRMPPEHRYPAALDDCLTVYRALLRDHDPRDIAIGGGSAGGNLAAALILRAHDEGLPMPAALVLRTPEVDLTESGDSFHTNAGLDNVLTGSLMNANLLYADGHDLAHPFLSPLFGTIPADHPPTILTTGTRDLFLSNTVRMHRALRNAGVRADLHVLDAGAHAGFLGTAPEDHEVDAEVRAFLEAHWRS